ncbi:MAG: hypothetical protein HGA65_03245 [Oscillochloris sp.]|nr:hypothetical protein [Oscillochloris sp.]
MNILQPTADPAQQSLDACARLLAAIFQPGEQVWICEAAYEINEPIWRVTLLCPGERGVWVFRRYRYDIPSGTLHFTGMMPAGEADLAVARRSGRPL